MVIFFFDKSIYTKLKAVILANDKHSPCLEGKKTIRMLIVCREIINEKTKKFSQKILRHNASCEAEQMNGTDGWNSISVTGCWGFAMHWEGTIVYIFFPEETLTHFLNHAFIMVFEYF